MEQVLPAAVRSMTPHFFDQILTCSTLSYTDSVEHICGLLREEDADIDIKSNFQ